MAGAIRQLKRQLHGKQIIFADCGVVFNGCRVALIIDSPEQSVLAKKFGVYMGYLAGRAREFNLADMLECQGKVRAIMDVEGSLLN